MVVTIILMLVFINSQKKSSSLSISQTPDSSPWNGSTCDVQNTLPTALVSLPEENFVWFSSFPVPKNKNFFF